MPRSSQTLVYYEPAGKIQNSEWNLINYPPEGYKFVTNKTFTDRIVTHPFLFDKLRLKVMDRCMPLNLVKAYIDSKCKPLPVGTKLVYAYNHVVFRPVPWVVHVEW